MQLLLEIKMDLRLSRAEVDSIYKHVGWVTPQTILGGCLKMQLATGSAWEG